MTTPFWFLPVARLRSQNCFQLLRGADGHHPLEPPGVSGTAPGKGFIGPLDHFRLPDRKRPVLSHAWGNRDLGRLRANMPFAAIISPYGQMANNHCYLYPLVLGNFKPHLMGAVLTRKSKHRCKNSSKKSYGSWACSHIGMIQQAPGECKLNLLPNPSPLPYENCAWPAA